MCPINNRTGDTTTSCFCEKLNMCVPCDLSGQHPPCIGHKSSPLADMEAAADHLNSFYVRQCHLLLARSKYLETEQYCDKVVFLPITAISRFHLFLSLEL